MPFEKGKEKTGGRTKGATNKVTTRVRESFTNLLEDNLEQLTNDFKELEPRDRIKLFLELSQYVLPKLKQTELKGSIESTVNTPLTKQELKNLNDLLNREY